MCFKKRLGLFLLIILSTSVGQAARITVRNNGALVQEGVIVTTSDASEIAAVVSLLLGLYNLFKEQGADPFAHDSYQLAKTIGILALTACFIRFCWDSTQLVVDRVPTAVGSWVKKAVMRWNTDPNELDAHTIARARLYFSQLSYQLTERDSCDINGVRMRHTIAQGICYLNKQLQKYTDHYQQDRPRSWWKRSKDPHQADPHLIYYLLRLTLEESSCLQRALTSEPFEREGVKELSARIIALLADIELLLDTQPFASSASAV